MRCAAEVKSLLCSKLGLMRPSNDCRVRERSNEGLVPSFDILVLSIDILGVRGICGSGRDSTLFKPIPIRGNSNDGTVLSVPSLPFVVCCRVP